VVTAHELGEAGQIHHGQEPSSVIPEADRQAIRQADVSARRPAYAGQVLPLSNWARRHPRLIDSVPATILVLAGLAALIGQHELWQIPLVLGLTIPVVVRRQYPLTAFVVALAVGAIQVLVNSLLPADLAIVLLLYTLAVYCPRRVSRYGLLACLLGSAAEVGRLMTTTKANPLGALATGAIAFGGPLLIAWAWGDSIRNRRAYYAALEDRAARLERERDAQAQVAAAAERARIARELHDVIAHNVSVMVVQADGAAYALDRSPEKARQALAAISSTGRQALAEMRQMLGVLRSVDEAPDTDPQPGLDQLSELLEQTRASGLAVSFTVQGVPHPLADGVALAAYRTVQESLTNVRKHGGPGARADVVLRYCPDAVMLTISDDGQGAAADGDGAGHGLIGMRERAAVHGGTLHAGPQPGGGYKVTARLPLALPAGAA
jgi:signal transduction histidine kinase